MVFSLGVEVAEGRSLDIRPESLLFAPRPPCNGDYPKIHTINQLRWSLDLSASQALASALCTLEISQ